MAEKFWRQTIERVAPEHRISVADKVLCGLPYWTWRMLSLSRTSGAALSHSERSYDGQTT